MNDPEEILDALAKIAQEEKMGYPSNSQGLKEVSEREILQRVKPPYKAQFQIVSEDYGLVANITFTNTPDGKVSWEEFKRKLSLSFFFSGEMKYSLICYMEE